MKGMTRDQAINAIRGKLLSLVDDEHSMCEVAARLGIYCGGFARDTTGELRKRYDWIVKNQPWLKRKEIEDQANRWQLARQFVLGTLISCDTQAEDHERHHTCMGWREFTDEKLAIFHKDLLGEEIEIVAPRAGAGSFAEEHRAVRDTAGEILHFLEAGAHDRIGLRGEIEGFRRRLASHFACEEIEWKGRGPVDRTTSTWIERLVGEHRGFERRLETVLSRWDAKEGPDSPPIAEIGAEIRAILKELLEHELSESRLFQRTVFEGAADLSRDSRAASPRNGDQP